MPNRTKSRKSKPPPTPEAAAIRILLAEDHFIVRDGLAAIINQQEDMEVVAQAGDGADAVQQWKSHRPDVTLMDLRMPGLSGANAIYELHEIDRQVRTIVLTTFDGDEDIYRAIRAGARAYLLKDVSRQDFLQCIREVHAGKYFIPPAVAAKLASRQAVAEPTSREMDVLKLLAEGNPNKLIAMALDISEVTVKSHVRALFSKLNVLSRTEAIAAASRSGLIRF
jgi:two-component system NarL family response regulator